MIERIALVVVCVPSIGFLLYVLFGLQRENRREQRDRLGATVLINRQRYKVSISTSSDGTTNKSNTLHEYKPQSIRPIDRESAGMGFDLQPLRKTSSGGSRWPTASDLGSILSNSPSRTTFGPLGHRNGWLGLNVWRQTRRPVEENSMSDLLMVGITIGFFIVALLYANGCEKLM
jgi:hypothetical protein